MKSLRYILGGRPHTIDDCLDLSCRQLPAKVTLEVTSHELMSELEILRRFVGTFQWQFRDCHVCRSDIYGCVSLLAKKQKQQSCLAAANAKLQRCLEEIQECGIKVSGADRRFEDLEHLCARI